MEALRHVFCGHGHGVTSDIYWTHAHDDLRFKDAPSILGTGSSVDIQREPQTDAALHPENAINVEAYITAGAGRYTCVIKYNCLF